MLPLASRYTRATASATSSGVCVPPGASRKTKSPPSEENLSRTAALSNPDTNLSSPASMVQPIILDIPVSGYAQQDQGYHGGDQHDRGDEVLGVVVQHGQQAVRRQTAAAPGHQGERARGELPHHHVVEPGSGVEGQQPDDHRVVPGQLV